MLEERIATKVEALGGQTLSTDMTRLLKRNVLDAFSGICASLQDVPLLEKFKRYAAAFPDADGVGVWGIGSTAHIVHGTFLNTILGRRSDLVNTYLSPDHMGGSHPSDNLSLLLTLADWRGLTGAQLLRGLYVAYMLSCAFSDYYDPEGGGFDHDAVAGVYTALITGHVLGLGHRELVEAQRMAGAMGLNPNQGGEGVITDWKHCTYASCAMRGVSAAVMAQAGFQGPVDIYKGAAGLDRFLPHATAFMQEPPDLGRVVFKRWQALVFCQTAIDTALMLHPAFHRLDAASVSRVDVWTYHMAMVQAGTADAANPVSRAGRTHSLSYCVAAALLRGVIDYDTFGDQAARSPELTALMAKIVLHDDPAMTEAYPDKSPCRIVIHVAGSSSLEARLEYPKGDPRAPLSDADIETKTARYLARLVDPQTARSMVDRLWAIEEEQELGWLLAPLQQEVRRE
ncbi:MmgE/PrpD family protein [Fundidesulfovibrio butyratiphilus]